jgi:hypothetical protein
VSAEGAPSPPAAIDPQRYFAAAGTISSTTLLDVTDKSVFLVAFLPKSPSYVLVRHDS